MSIVKTKDEDDIGKKKEINFFKDLNEFFIS